MKKLLQSILLSLPQPIRDMMISFYGKRLEKLRKGGDFNKFYRELMNHLSLDETQLLQVQLKELKSLLIETMEYSPYYKNILASVGMTKEKINDSQSINEILSLLPITDKLIFRNHIEDITNKNPKRKTIGIGHTSGTTGTPLFYPYDIHYMQRTFAEWERYYRWLNLPEKFSSIRFSGRIIVAPTKKEPPFWSFNSASNQLLMSTYHLSPENLQYYVQKIEEFKPQLIDGYPSAIYVISRFINSKGISIVNKPIAISTTSETLSDYQREEIETAFRCKVYNQYASAEGSPWIVECSHGSMHMWTDTGVIEFINEEITGEGIQVELVVTSFRNRKTPLIRYRIGDYVILSDKDENCSCGSKFPIVRKVIGRQDDIMYTSEKGYVGRLSPAIKEVKSILRARLRQIELDKFILTLMVDDNYDDSSERLLLKVLKERLGERVKIEIIITDDIPLGKNGKFKAFINEMDMEEIQCQRGS